jgi:hypothetical protein
MALSVSINVAGISMAKTRNHMSDASLSML